MGVDLTWVMRKEERTDTQTEKLGLGRPCAVMEMYQQKPGNSEEVGLLYTVEQGGNEVS